MLTLKKSTIAFVVALALLGMVDALVSLSPFFYGGVTAVYLVMLVYGSARINSQFYLTTKNEGATDRKQIAITFDDGPVSGSTLSLLEVLKEYQVEAAFFILGRKVAANEEIIRRVDAAGHLLGNHTYSHLPWFNILSMKRTVEELKRTEEIIAQIVGRKMRLFRPPFGVTNPTLKRAVNVLDYTVIGWNVKSLDTVLKGEDAIVERVTINLKPGAVVLFHETTPNIAGIVRNLLLYLREHGYEVVRVDKLLGVEAYR
jgi:peptidoglycan/xylan/chitin deacetylase (PgdA/CDA1 family)